MLNGLRLRVQTHSLRLIDAACLPVCLSVWCVPSMYIQNNTKVYALLLISSRIDYLVAAIKLRHYVGDWFDRACFRPVDSSLTGRSFVGIQHYSCNIDSMSVIVNFTFISTRTNENERKCFGFVRVVVVAKHCFICFRFNVWSIHFIHCIVTKTVKFTQG